MELNTEIRNFETNLVAFINGYNIPIESKRIVLELTLTRVREAANRVIIEEGKLAEAEKNAEDVQPD